MEGITFDTGALVALEARKSRIAQVFALATKDARTITIPVAVVGKWWRGRSEARERILRAVTLEPMTLALAKVAGEAIANVRGATLFDAVVMASAARRGDVVYTSDVDDLMRLQRQFPTVRVLHV